MAVVRTGRRKIHQRIHRMTRNMCAIIMVELGVAREDGLEKKYVWRIVRQ